jgi:glycosyltransferase involved in cell wall biosynthesis
MITAVIPSYNHEKFIEECLEPLISRPDIFSSIIVIDDNSKDGTVAAVERLKKLSDKIVLKIKNRNRGVVDSLNMAMNLVSSEYVYFCASDDIPDVVGIESLLKKMAQQEAIKCIFGNAKYFQAGKVKKVYRRSHKKFLTSGIERICKNLFIDYPKPLLLQSCLFRSAAIREIGCWDSDVVVDDHSLFIKFFRSNKDLNFCVALDANACFYRIHGENFSINAVDQFKTQIQVISKYGRIKEFNKNVAYRYMFHVLSCLKKKEFSAIPLLTELVSIKIFLISFTFIPKIVFSYLGDG